MKNKLKSLGSLLLLGYGSFMAQD